MLCAALLLAPAVARGGPVVWTRIQSDNFELITSAGEKKGREVILYFERVQAVFEKILKSKDTSPLPVRVVVFRTKKEFEPFRIHESTGAFYMSSRDRDYIIMSGGGVEDYPIALHEYTHLLLRHGKQKVPLWLNEGLAELYSSLTPQGKRVMIGSLHPGRMQVLDREKWIPLSRLVDVEQKSPEYTDKKLAGMFYAESWALTHMLMLQDNYRKEMPKLLNAFDAGKTPAEAFQAAYGVPLDHIDKVLRGYVRGDRFNAGFFDVTFDKAQKEVEATALTAYEGDILLAELFLGAGKLDEARRMYEALSNQQPNHPEAFEALGYLELHGGNHEAGRQYLARAVALGSKNPRAYRDYATLLESGGNHGPELKRVLEKALSLEPDSVELRMRLARSFLRNDEFAQALQEYRKIQKVTPEQATEYFHNLFYVCYRVGDKDCALSAAKRLRERAKTPSEILEADRRLKALEQPKPVERAEAREEPPRQQRIPSREPARAEKPTAESTASDGSDGGVLGTLVKLDCNANPARLTVNIGGKPSEFVIDSSGGIQLQGFGPDTVELDCGPLKAAQVSLTFWRDERTNPPQNLLRSLRIVKRPQ